MTAGRKNYLNIALILVSLSVCILLLELSLALFWPHKITAKPFFHIQSFFCEYHPLLGWVNKPDYRDIVKIDDDHDFFITHNSKGLRDREHDYARPDGVKRVLVLGDSFVWGFGVEDNEVLTSVLESRSDTIEAINCGVSGYGTDQALLFYTDKAYKYDHDLVVYAFYANDLAELSRTISYGYPKPMFVPGSDPFTVTNVPVAKTTETERKLFGNPVTLFGKVKKFLRRSTHTYPFIVGRLNSVAPLRKIFLTIGLADDYSRSLPGIPYYALENTEETWQLFFRIVKEFRMIANENGADFLLVHIPVKETPDQGADPSSHGEAMQNDSTSKMLTEFSSRNGIHFIDMLTAIRAGSRKGMAYYSPHKLDIHFNESGHRLMADAIYQWMQQNP
jgi:lysophospholipase L1-like esterase